MVHVAELAGSAELLPSAVLHALVCAHARAGWGPSMPWPSDFGSVDGNVDGILLVSGFSNLS